MSGRKGLAFFRQVYKFVAEFHIEFLGNPRVLFIFLLVVAGCSGELRGSFVAQVSKESGLGPEAVKEEICKVFSASE